MKYFLFALVAFVLCKISLAQTTTGTHSKILKAEKIATTNEHDLLNTNWGITLKQMPIHKPETPQGLMQDKKPQANAILNYTSTSNTQNKKRGSAPVMAKGFIANYLDCGTPSDNSVAVSPNGWVISVDNCTVSIFDTNGVQTIPSVHWNDFILNNPSYVLGKYDPRVVYDNVHDRFVIIILHGPVDKTLNSILIAFSKTGNPTQGWNIYGVGSNYAPDTTWFDFPNIATTNNELFITGNMFKIPPTYLYGGPSIFQISLLDGYAGTTTLDYKRWNHITTNNTMPAGMASQMVTTWTTTNMPGYTLVPAQQGWGQPLGPDMNFVMLWPDADSNLYTFNINKELTDTTAQLTTTTVPITKFKYCRDGYIKNKTTGDFDSISTGAPWVQNAYILDSIIHFTYDAESDPNYCGISYARYNLRTQNVQTALFKKPMTYLAYPAVAPFSNSLHDKSAAIVFVQADTNTFPQINAIKVDDNMNFSNDLILRVGDTMLNLLPAGLPYAERWGDYTGIQKMYRSTGAPEVWAAASFADSSNAIRLTSYNTWVAKLINTDNVASIASNIKPQHVKVYPNPATEIVTFEFDNTQTGNVKIEVVDYNGKVVKQFYNGSLYQGKVKLSFNQLALSSGVYYINAHNAKKELMWGTKLVVK